MISTIGDAVAVAVRPFPDTSVHVPPGSSKVYAHSWPVARAADTAAGAGVGAYVVGAGVGAYVAAPDPAASLRSRLYSHMT